MNTVYKPFIFKLPQIDKIENFEENDVIKTTNISQPLFSLGFHSFIHRTKSAMDITKKLETQNKFYYIVNPFEHNINDYENDVAHVSEIFLNKPNVLSRAFYKFWEILYTFDIANKTNMSMVGIAEGPGSFIQAFVSFREKYYNVEKDKIYGLTINNDNMNISKVMTDGVNKKYNNLINILKTSKKTEGSITNGDVTKLQTIHYLKEQVKHKADLVTADGGFEWKNENYQEQEAYVLILGEMISAINIQAKNGSFVLKIFETFTHTTIKLLYILGSFYEEIYIYKPFFSRSTNSEKYVICKGFKYESDNETLKKRIKVLEDTLKKCNDNKDNKFINDIFPKFKLTEEQLNIFKYVNINIANIQQIMINNLVVYIKSNNYFGDSYHNYRDLQIKANKWWIENFFTEKLNEKTTMVKETIKYNDSELNLFVKKLF
jgi:23S rRNA U2552 (ribose-2'-O)-methylase RlmE/FtsJ